MKIGLVGLARSGKDTICQMIQQYLEQNGHGKTKRLAFGDELKNRLFAAFPEIAHRDKKPREFYESFGELGRQINPKMWIEPVEFKLNFFEQSYQNFVLTDIRQPNEAQWAIENGFVLVNVRSPERLRKQRSQGDMNWTNVNPSEKHLGDIAHYSCTHTIFNDNTLEDLETQVQILLKELLG